MNRKRPVPNSKRPINASELSTNLDDRLKPLQKSLGDRKSAEPKSIWISEARAMSSIMTKWYLFQRDKNMVEPTEFIFDRNSVPDRKSQ